MKSKYWNAILIGIVVMAEVAVAQSLPPPLVSPTAGPPTAGPPAGTAAPEGKAPRPRRTPMVRKPAPTVQNEQRPDAAADLRSAEPKPAPTQQAVTRCEGQLAKVDPEQITITNFATNQTCILKRGEVPLADLKAGDEVVAEMNVETETLTKLSRK